MVSSVSISKSAWLSANYSMLQLFSPKRSANMRAYFLVNLISSKNKYFIDMCFLSALTRAIRPLSSNTFVRKSTNSKF